MRRNTSGRGGQQRPCRSVSLVAAADLYLLNRRLRQGLAGHSDGQDAVLEIRLDILLAISSEGLKGKQSVRATFRLPAQVIELLGIIAAQLGLKQKSLFDQLIEDVSVLDKVARRVRGYSPERSEQRRKTFVLSKRSRQVLDMISREQQIPQDILVEVSIKRLLPVMNAEQERHRKQRLILNDMQDYLDQGEKILRKADRLLGNEDQAYAMAKKIVTLCTEKVAELEAIIGKGQPMEDFEAAEKSG